MGESVPRHAEACSESSPIQNRGEVGLGIPFCLQKARYLPVTCWRSSAAISKASTNFSSSPISVVTANMRCTGASPRPASLWPLPRPRRRIFASVASKIFFVLPPPCPINFLLRSNPFHSMTSSRKKWHQTLSCCERLPPRLLRLPVATSANLPELKFSARSVGESSWLIRGSIPSEAAVDCESSSLATAQVLRGGVEGGGKGGTRGKLEGGSS
mmetsp:Transcript_23527/g.42428  ORF Transcript_23527/g.42428 Transcript_23527/m.42428 type:complete len:214 (-) Transcript_23527:434-1075(-)